MVFEKRMSNHVTKVTNTLITYFHNALIINKESVLTRICFPKHLQSVKKLNQID